jgi:hypothetical protein
MNPISPFRFFCTHCDANNVMEVGKILQEEGRMFQKQKKQFGRFPAGTWRIEMLLLDFHFWVVFWSGQFLPFHIVRSG